METTNKLKVTKLTNKVDGLDVKGQGCLTDCKSRKWVGQNSLDAGCTLVTESTAWRSDNW